MKLSGKVAILNATLDAVREIRDLGPDPIEVKENIVRPFTEVRPSVTVDEYYTSYVDLIEANLVTRTWSKASRDYAQEDQDKLNAALLEDGSVLRAVIAILRDEINILRTHPSVNLAPRSVDQVKTALKNQMR